jgi:hypothetical protein
MTLFHWVLVLFLLTGGLTGERLAGSPVHHHGDEDTSTERHDKAIKQAASRERTNRTPKTKWPRTALLAVTVWPPDRALVDNRRLSSSPATPWNPNLPQLHQIIRI